MERLYASTYHVEISTNSKLPVRVHDIFMLRLCFIDRKKKKKKKDIPSSSHKPILVKWELCLPQWLMDPVWLVFFVLLNGLSGQHSDFTTGESQKLARNNGHRGKSIKMEKGINTWQTVSSWWRCANGRQEILALILRVKVRRVRRKKQKKTKPTWSGETNKMRAI